MSGRHVADRGMGMPAPPEPPTAVNQMKLSCKGGEKVLAWVQLGDIEEEEAATSHRTG